MNRFRPLAMSSSMRMPLVRLLVSLVLWVVPAAVSAQLPAQLRRPIALAPSPEGRFLFVANRDSGTVSVIDLASQQIAREHKLGQRLADLAFVPRSGRLLAVDEARHDLVVLKTHGSDVEVIQRLALSPYPVSIQVAAGGREASICSLWSRRLTFVSLHDSARIEREIDLPFAPRAQIALPGRDRLLVAEAFGGKLALIDLAERRLREVRQIPGHNIRGAGVSPDGQMLVLAHQMLNNLAQSIRNDIHWGLLMSNDLRWLRVDSLLAGGEQLYRGAHMHPLGEAGRGGGDPGSLDVAADGSVVVALSGVNEIAFGKEGDFSMQRLKVGRRPMAVRCAADGRAAFIANTFDDSISILNLKTGTISATISLGLAPELSLAQRGELLFYDARLSHDNWMSCHSCHTDGHANGQLNDNFSDRSFGAAKRVLSLLGVKGTLPLAWNGQVYSFEQQIRNSIEGTMQREDVLPNEDVRALEAYLLTLEVPPSVDALRGVENKEQRSRGQVVFQRRECSRCHTPPTYTTSSSFDVGLRDSQGNTRFNPPSLRGISHRTPLLHDGRADTLEDVFLGHGHPSDSPFSPDEVRDLVAFLRGL